MQQLCLIKRQLHIQHLQQWSDSQGAPQFSMNVALDAGVQKKTWREHIRELFVQWGRRSIMWSRK